MTSITQVANEIIMTKEEEQPLVSSNNAPQDGNNTAQPQQQQRRRRRRKGLSPLVLFGLLSLLVITIATGIIVVLKSAQRRQRPKELWINVQGNTTASPGCETTILLMRHCEKFGPLVQKHGNQHCSYVGMERAHFMPSLFGHKSRWPNPSYLYALSPTRKSHLNFRQVETLTPLATKLLLKVNSTYQEGQYPLLAKHLFEKMQTGDMCGKLTIVSWTHRSLPQLAHALGCPSLQWGGCPRYFPETSFDDVWQLKYVYGPKLRPHKKKDKSKWHVYATLTGMDFDPLAFSNSVRDYPDNGVETGGRWFREL